MTFRRTFVFLAANASYAHSSLAAAYLRRVVDPSRWRWRTVEVTLDDDLPAVVGEVLSERPDGVGATLYLFNRRFVLSVLRRVRALLPECVVLAGGPECLGDNRALTRRGGGVDAAVRGEGERALPALLASFERRERTWAAVPGVCGLFSGRYHDGGTAETVKRLDDLPSPYGDGFPPPGRPMVQLETSRGCANQCTFCTSGGAAPVRYLSLRRVRSDLERIRAAGVRDVRVVDRTFNGEARRCRDLLALFGREFPDFRFHLEIDPARVGPGFVRDLDRAGPQRFHLEAGVQTLTPAVYRYVGRQATTARTLAGLRRLGAVSGVRVHVDLIAGLPGDTWEGLREALEQVIALKPEHVQVELLKVLPGTRLAAERGRWGVVAAPEPPYEVLRTATMSAEDLSRAARWSRLVDWFYNAPALRETVAAAALALPSLWDDLDRAATTGTTGRLACPSLERRFGMLDGLLAGGPPGLRHRLHYAWLKHGFSARHGLCAARPWKEPVPPDAELLEGVREAAGGRLWLAELDHPYLFAYGTGAHGGRAAVAIFRLPARR